MTQTPRLDDFLGTRNQTKSPWHAYGLLGNPFPSRSHPIWEVMHNQERVMRRFYEDLAAFLRDGNTATMFFTGGNRVGKTHFCQHHRLMLPAEFQQRGYVLPIAVISAQSCNFTELYRELIDQVDDSLRNQSGAGLFEDSDVKALCQKLENALAPGDFKNAMRRLAQTAASSANDETRIALRRWLRGERLPAMTLRKTLQVAASIDSLGHQLNALEGLMNYLRVRHSVVSGPALTAQHGCIGVLVFLDELELIWTHRRDRRDRFLQAIRAMIDACPKGLMLVVAMATELGPALFDVEMAYPALYARLKGSRVIPALVEIPDPSEAWAYYTAFLEHGREQAMRQGVQSGSAELFTVREVERLFREVASGGTASQGDFFDKLNIAADERVQG